MEALRMLQELEEDGTVTLTGLPWPKGQRVELIVMPEGPSTAVPRMSARRLLESGLVGIWRDRDDMGDSVEFARSLREQAQRRGA